MEIKPDEKLDQKSKSNDIKLKNKSKKFSSAIDEKRELSVQLPVFSLKKK